MIACELRSEANAVREAGSASSAAANGMPPGRVGVGPSSARGTSGKTSEGEIERSAKSDIEEGNTRSGTWKELNLKLKMGKGINGM